MFNICFFAGMVLWWAMSADMMGLARGEAMIFGALFCIFLVLITIKDKISKP